MKPYRWVCHSCQAANAAETTTCSSCGFPAVATGRQIEASHKPGAIPPYEESSTFLALPFHQKVAFVIVVGTMGVGLLLAKFAGPFELNFIDLGILAFGFFVLWLLGFYRGKSHV